jgi:molybdenum cofactor cytidylyltransferase
LTREIDGILLAAGESRRMGYPKPLLSVGKESFLSHTAAIMLEVVERLIIVLGAHSERVRPAVPVDSRIVVVENRHYEHGQLSSLKAGIPAATASAALVHLADHPLVKSATFEALVAGYRRLGKPIVIARHLGRRGHPVIFARALFDELLGAPEDQGARVVVNADPSRVAYVDVDDSGVTTDLDTPADLERAGLPGPPTGVSKPEP